jgi:hypothetical protein
MLAVTPAVIQVNNLNRMAPKRFGTRGSSGSAMLMSLLILTAVSTAMLVILNYSVSSVKRTNYHHDAILTYLEQLTAVIEHDPSWDLTIQKHSSGGPGSVDTHMTCLRVSGFPVCPAGQHKVNVYLENKGNSDKKDRFNRHDGPEGFDKYGLECDKYDAVNGHPTCIYKARVKWRAIYPPGGSTATVLDGDFAKNKPAQEIEIKIFHKSPDSPGPEMELQNRGLTYVRGRMGGSLTHFCASISGKLVAGGMHCRQVPVTPFNCRTAGFQMVDRVTGTGEVVCTTPSFYGGGAANTVCPDGTAVTAVSGDEVLCSTF